jgi:hypothetical protein
MSNTEAPNSKVEAFWDAMPDGTTIDQCADGITVDFKFEGKQYSVDTKLSGRVRTMSIQSYYDALDRAALNAEPKVQTNAKG